MARTRRGAGGLKVTPNLAWDREGTRVLNLRVLRRLDPDVADILITAAHVVAYSYDEDELEWSRKRVEGSLFIVKRTENLVEDLLTNFEVQVQVPYLMYRNDADEIIGIWFYDPQECQEVASLFTRIEYAYSKASPNANRSVLEELEVTSGPSALPATEDALEQLISPTMIADDVEEFLLTPRKAVTSPTVVADDVEEFLLTPSKAATCVHTTGGIGALQPNQSFRAIPSPSHGSHSATAPQQASSLHSLLPSRTSSVTLGAFYAHRSNSSTTVQPASLLDSKPPPLAPMASTQPTIANAASSLSTVPPLHPSLLHPFPLPTVLPIPPYGMPLLQPFPPPNLSPLLTPSTSYYSQVLTREQVRTALLRLAQNDDLIDMVYREMAKRPYP